MIPVHFIVNSAYQFAYVNLMTHHSLTRKCYWFTFLQVSTAKSQGLRMAQNISEWLRSVWTCHGPHGCRGSEIWGWMVPRRLRKKQRSFTSVSPTQPKRPSRNCLTKFGLFMASSTILYLKCFETSLCWSVVDLCFCNIIQTLRRLFIFTFTEILHLHCCWTCDAQPENRPRPHDVTCDFDWFWPGLCGEAPKKAPNPGSEGNTFGFCTSTCVDTGYGDTAGWSEDHKDTGGRADRFWRWVSEICWSCRAQCRAHSKVAEHAEHAEPFELPMLCFGLTWCCRSYFQTIDCSTRRTMTANTVLSSQCHQCHSPQFYSAKCTCVASLREAKAMELICELPGVQDMSCIVWSTEWDGLLT